MIYDLDGPPQLAVCGPIFRINPLSWTGKEYLKCRGSGLTLNLKGEIE